DHFPVKANVANINSDDWDICYASTLSRAYETAKTIYQGKDLIIEVPLSAFMRTNVKLPSMVWHVGGRVAWFFSSQTQKENISGTKKRIDEFMKIIEESGHKNILVVSHGFFMKVFARQLKKHGFTGTIDFAPKNGKLYLFEK
ncbi:MAG: histidine phosphatase family protein, partial [Chlorobi bacterium]|nr:histidine phosphatase family protein [Chlorobiota bacterium]